jgi:hypothetical protein
MTVTYTTTLRRQILTAGGDPDKLVAAGVLPEEMQIATDGRTLLISASGVQKLCAISPNREAAAAMSEIAAAAIRGSFRIIEGGKGQSEIGNSSRVSRASESEEADMASWLNNPALLRDELLRWREFDRR